MGPMVGAFQVIAALLAKAAVSVLIYKILGTHWCTESKPSVGCFGRPKMSEKKSHWHCRGIHCSAILVANAEARLHVFAMPLCILAEGGKNFMTASCREEVS